MKMTFNMRNGIAVAICLAAVMMFAVSCGGNANKKQAADGATEKVQAETKADAPKGGAVALKDANATNWQAAVKSNFGVDVPLPDGWAVKSARSFNGRTNLNVVLTTGGGTTGEAEGRRLFEATKALSPHGNYKGVPDWDNDTVSAGDAIADFAATNSGGAGQVIAKWNFTYNSQMIMVSYMAMGNEADYTFTINAR